MMVAVVSACRRARARNFIELDSLWKVHNAVKDINLMRN